MDKGENYNSLTFAKYINAIFTHQDCKKIIQSLQCFSNHTFFLFIAKSTLKNSFVERSKILTGSDQKSNFVELLK